MPLNLSNGQFKIYVGISMNDRRCRSESLFFAGESLVRSKCCSVVAAAAAAAAAALLKV